MIKQEIRQAVLVAIKKTYPKAKVSGDDINIETPKNPKFGDLSVNIAFSLAKNLKKAPQEIAERIGEHIKGKNFKSAVFGGFINFRLNPDFFQNALSEILKKGKKFGDSKILAGKKYQVEFISANPTGPLTIANGRGGFAGDVLTNVLKKAGAKVQKEYYVNDGGNQVRILGKSILISQGLLEGDGDFYRGDYIEKWAKKNIVKVKRYKKNPFGLGRLAAKDILEGFIKKTAKAMQVEYDKWFSEHTMIKAGSVDKSIQSLKRKKLTKTKEKALWFKTTKYGDDKDRVLVKSDGDKTYFANDVAYHWDKFSKRRFDKVIDIWGADHHGYVGRMLAATEAMGFGGQLDIILTQWVRLIKDGKEFSISKRKGTYVTVDDLLGAINKKNKKEAADVARFLFLMKSFNSQMDFSLDIAQEKEAQKNPVYYVKYAYARISGILKKKKSRVQKSKLELLTHPAELNLIKKMLELPELVEKISTEKRYPVHDLTYYSIDLATKFHFFYDKCRVIDEEDKDLTAARLKLVEATKNVLSIVAGDLIGIDTPEKM